MHRYQAQRSLGRAFLFGLPIVDSSSDATLNDEDNVILHSTANRPQRQSSFDQQSASSRHPVPNVYDVAIFYWIAKGRGSLATEALRSSLGKILGRSRRCNVKR